jgi:hypothetical protein
MSSKTVPAFLSLLRSDNLLSKSEGEKGAIFDAEFGQKLLNVSAQSVGSFEVIRLKESDGAG